MVSRYGVISLPHTPIPLSKHSTRHWMSSFLFLLLQIPSIRVYTTSHTTQNTTHSHDAFQLRHSAASRWVSSFHPGSSATTLTRFLQPGARPGDKRKSCAHLCQHCESIGKPRLGCSLTDLSRVTYSMTLLMAHVCLASRSLETSTLVS